MRTGKSMVRISGIALVLAVIVAMLSGLAGLSNVSTSIADASLSYDIQAAVNYAEAWWNGRNPIYHDYGDSDCANFVSQCLIAGGLDLSAGPGVDAWGCIPSVSNLDYNLRHYQNTQYQVGGSEPIWLVKGDPVLFYSNDGTHRHSAFGVVGDASNYWHGDAHSINCYHKNLSWFLSDPNLDYCVYFHIKGGTNGQPPTGAPSHILPHNADTGISLTPTFQWGSVANADYYALYISKPPYGASNLVFDSEEDYGPIYGTSFKLPSGILSEGVTYRWNMSAWNGAGRGPISTAWSFTTASVCAYSCWDRSALSGDAIAALGRSHFPLGGVPQTGESIRVTAYAVAKAESGGNPSACGDSDRSIGLWQINMDAHPTYDKCLLFEKDYNANAAVEISSSGTNWNPWCTWESSACGGNGNEAYKQFLTEARRHFYPKVTSLSVSQTSINLGDTVTIYCSVSDDTGLSRVELWRTTDISGGPDESNWAGIKETSISGTAYSGSFADTPTPSGSYWYGIHVVDNSGAPQAWNDERNSRTGGVPEVFEPKKVTVSQSTYPPQVTTNAAANVEETTATLNGVISVDGGEGCQYRFEYDTNSGEPYAYNTGWTGSKTTGQSFSAALSSLGKGTKYYFRAQAKNSAGTTSGSELTFLTKPDAPTSFSASTAGSTQIDLSWAKGGGAQKTKIQRKQGGYPTSKDDGTQVYFDTGTGHPDTGLTPGTTYYYRAWSYVQGSEQWSDNYAEASATAGSSNVPPVLSNGYVDPPNGTTSTNFYYYVTYYDADGDSPGEKSVYVDGTFCVLIVDGSFCGHAMSLYSGTASNGVYRYGPVTLGAGSHYYYFSFDDGNGHPVRLPPSDAFPGPSVTAPKGVNITLQPATKHVGVGEAFDLIIQAEAGDQPVSGIDVFVNFAPAYLEVQSITAGTSLPTVIQNTYDNAAGTIDYSAGKQLVGLFATGTFTVATIHFSAKASTSPSTALAFSTDLPRETKVDDAGIDVTGAITGGTVFISSGTRVDISAVLQGGSRPPEGWAVPIIVRFFTPGAYVMTDTPLQQFDLTTTKSGSTAVCQCVVAPGTYDITAISEHTLLNVKRNVVISGPSTAVNMGILLEGNANDDSIINISDFGILAESYMKMDGEPGYDGRADFDRNGIINITDFGLLADNYVKMSPIDVSA